MYNDVLFFPPNQIDQKRIYQKQEDVTNSAKAVLVTGTLSGLIIYFNFSIYLAAFTLTATGLLIACWRKESERLAIMKKIPLKDSSDCDSSRSSSEPASPISPMM
jgi:hypothetical protein